jgi:hypothetical protein
MNNKHKTPHVMDLVGIYDGPRERIGFWGHVHPYTLQGP